MQRRHLNRLFRLVMTLTLLASSALGAAAQVARPGQIADLLQQPEQRVVAWQEAPYSVFLPLVGHANPPITRFLALWRNENSAAQRIAHVAIRTQGNTVYVHIWERCPPAFCDWGETTTTVWDAADGTLNLTWNFPLRVETQEITVLPDNRLRVTGQAVNWAGRVVNDYVEYFSPPTPGDTAHAAIRLENLSLNQTVYAVGEVILASARFVNRSPLTLQLVVADPYPWCNIGIQQQWIERLGPDPSIPPFDAAGIFFDGRRYAAGGGVLVFQSCMVAPDEGRDAANAWNRTGGFPIGDYRFYMEYWTLDYLVMQSESLEFEITTLR